MKTKEYKINEPVIGPEIKSGSFFKSKMAATGIPKLETGPQKWVVQTYLNDCLENKKSLNFLNPDSVACLADMLIGASKAIISSHYRGNIRKDLRSALMDMPKFSGGVLESVSRESRIWCTVIGVAVDWYIF